jgi:hypothetical protein
MPIPKNYCCHDHRSAYAWTVKIMSGLKFYPGKSVLEYSMQIHQREKRNQRKVTTLFRMLLQIYHPS